MQKYKEAMKSIEELKHENKMLKNRCSVYSGGVMCAYCPYICENRSQKYRGINDAG